MILRRRSRLAAVLVGALALTTAAISPSPVGATGTPVPPAVQSRTSSTVTAVALPTVQIDNGVVWSLTVSGHTVYAGGTFSYARPAGAAAGTHLTRRWNLLAFDITTGRLLSFAPVVNGSVKVVSLSPDRRRLYIGGSFTRVNGQAHNKLAAFDTATGRLITTFKAQVGGSYVNAIAAGPRAVYVGGLFTAADGRARRNLAAFDLAGRVATWAPTTDRQVDAMVISPDGTKAIVGGRFTHANSHARRGLVAITLSNGRLAAWAAASTIVNGDGQGRSGIYSLSRSGTAVYGTGWNFSPLGARAAMLEGAFAADGNTGALRWVEDCHGDTYDSYSDGTQVYVVGHPHDCSGVGGYPQLSPPPGNLRHALAFTAARRGVLGHPDTTSGGYYHDWAGTPAPAMINWFPDFATGKWTGQGQAAWTISGGSGFVVAGGEFPTVNNRAQYGLVRFGVPAVAGTRTDGPRLSGVHWPATAASGGSPGTVTVGIPQNYDRDDRLLTYRLYGGPGLKYPSISPAATPLCVRTSAVSLFWTSLAHACTIRPTATPTTYVWSATDPDGNTSVSAPIALLALDTFTRPVGDGTWDSADDGGAWTTAGAATFDVDGSNGGMAVAPDPTQRTSTADLALPDQTGETLPEHTIAAEVSVGLDTLPVDGVAARLALRDAQDTEYALAVVFGPTRPSTDPVPGNVSLSLQKTVAGTTTTLASAPVNFTYVAGPAPKLRLRLTEATVAGSTPTVRLSGAVWTVGTTAPATAPVTFTDSDPASLPVDVGLRTDVPPDADAPTVTASFDDLVVLRS